MNKQTKNTHQFLQELEFCVFDLETTGGNQKSDKIIEIGMVKIKNLKIVAEKSYLIDPEIKIPEFIQRLTSIRAKDLKGAPKIEEVMDDILAFMGDTILVAHNTSFDIPFFNSVLRRLDRQILKNKGLCTNLMTKYLIPNLLNSNLNYMSQIFGINHKKAHRALDDAVATAKLLLKYLDIFMNKDIAKINHLYYPRNKYELDRLNLQSNEISNEQVVETLDKIKSPYLIILKGENGTILFALPCKRRKDEIKYIEKMLKNNDWTMITIRLFGPFIEAFSHFSNLFLKIELATRAEILTFLWTLHIPQKKKENVISNTLVDEDKIDTVDHKLGDFLIVCHIVPEQMIIWPLSTFGTKSSLIFRWPGHKKKLIQFINSRASQMSTKHAKKNSLPIPLKEFIVMYLKAQKENGGAVFLLKKELPLKKSSDFQKQMEMFLTKHPNPNKYPENYIKKPH